ncbi:MAG: response regulator [Chitinivibrionales bacterium]|nr:response regulator [Chitinivibrionales bacterium]
MSVKKTVLLVDDDNDFLLPLVAAVKKEYAVLTANSGAECLAIVEKSRPDLIVMDVMMSTLSDGLETAKKLKINEDTRSIPLIMLTGVNEHFDYREQIDESYFPNDKWIDKPIKPERLLKEIKSLLEA